MPAIPEREIPVNFLQETGEKCAETLARVFVDIRPSISRENREGGNRDLVMRF